MLVDETTLRQKLIDIRSEIKFLQDQERRLEEMLKRREELAEDYNYLVG